MPRHPALCTADGSSTVFFTYVPPGRGHNQGATCAPTQSFRVAVARCLRTWSRSPNPVRGWNPRDFPDASMTPSPVFHSLLYDSDSAEGLGSRCPACLGCLAEQRGPGKCSLHLADGSSSGHISLLLASQHRARHGWLHRPSAHAVTASHTCKRSW